MVIFHGYVTQPEGRLNASTGKLKLDDPSQTGLPETPFSITGTAVPLDTEQPYINSPQRMWGAVD